MDNNVSSQPLVSCTVLSYNSSKTIIETLDSIAAQTYSNIELIVSDDCSNDNTVEVVSQWLDSHKSRFVRTLLLTVPNNTGVCANSNRALNACQGVWKKGIAADDILLPDCIADFVSYVDEHPAAMWVSSQIRKYYNTFDEENCFAREHVMSRSFFDCEVNEQLKIMARRDVVYAQALFINRHFLQMIGGYDESLAFEDYSFCMDALESGHKCYLLEKETACYRIHDSMCRSSERIFNYNFLKKVRPFYIERCFKYLSKWQILGIKIQWKVEDVFEYIGMNSNKRHINVFLYKKLSGAVLRIFK